jgi:hypothetical protein
MAPKIGANRMHGTSRLKSYREQHYERHERQTKKNGVVTKPAYDRWALPGGTADEPGAARRKRYLPTEITTNTYPPFNNHP